MIRLACWRYMLHFFLTLVLRRKQKFHHLKIFNKELFQTLPKDHGLFVKLITRLPVMLMQESIVTAKDINGAPSHQFTYPKNILVSESPTHCTLHCLKF